MDAIDTRLGSGLPDRSWVLVDAVVADATPLAEKIFVLDDEVESAATVGTGEGPGHLPDT